MDESHRISGAGLLAGWRTCKLKLKCFLNCLLRAKIYNECMNGLLVRVGIDSTDGGWNAPMRLASGEFAYVTITEDIKQQPRDGMARRYDEFVPTASRFGKELPPNLLGALTHLDPDFDHLTYGDRHQCGNRIKSFLTPGDLLAFFAALRPVDGPPRPLIYALIGLYVIEEIVPAKEIPQARWSENAHTRRIPGDSDIVVRARRGVSGRLRRCIPIGEWRDGAYRVRHDLLDAWGGLGVKNGWIQRRGWLPDFQDAAKFYDWFLAQNPKLTAENNPL